MEMGRRKSGRRAKRRQRNENRIRIRERINYRVRSIHLSEDWIYLFCWVLFSTTISRPVNRLALSIYNNRCLSIRWNICRERVKYKYTPTYYRYTKPEIQPFCFILSVFYLIYISLVWWMCVRAQKQKSSHQNSTNRRTNTYQDRQVR